MIRESFDETHGTFFWPEILQLSLSIAELSIRVTVWEWPFAGGDCH
jgi:hypothetical protein